MIITISRQFGSGGREIGARLAEHLKLRYFDKELVSAIAKNTALNEKYVSEVLDNGGFNNFAFSFARGMTLAATTPPTVTDILVEQQNVIKQIGKKGDCVIVGRCADVILQEYNPVKIFIYADVQSRLRRCRERAEEGENYTDRQLIKAIKAIDKGRAKLHDLLSSPEWGNKECYDVMLNTSDIKIDNVIPALAKMAACLWEDRHR